MTEFIIRDQILIKYHGHAETVHIPSDVHTIGRRAFYKCTSLITLCLPSSVKVIETEAFYGCHCLKDILFSDGLLEIHHRAFWFCSSLGSVTLPHSIMTIGSRAFECCTALRSADIGNPSVEIDEYAFNETAYWHNSLKKAASCHSGSDPKFCPDELRLPEGITHIDIWSYAGSNIKRVWLPNSLRTIGMCSFKDCKQLREISMTPNVYCNYRLKPGPSDGIFSGCEQLEHVIFRGELRSFVWYDSEQPEFLRGFDPEKTFMRCTELVPLHPQLIQRTRSDHNYALHEYLMEHRLITTENFEIIFKYASDSEAPDLIAALLEYKHKILRKEDDLWSI